MKHQYFGDENDYLKYSLLRSLSGDGNLRVMVSWMLTPNDSSKDGRKTGYLQKPAKWRPYDPLIFDFLVQAILIDQRKSIDAVIQSTLLRGCSSFDQELLDDEKMRQRYFLDLSTAATSHDLIFFDPDIGIEVPSKPYGRKGSSKYVYWHELRNCYQQGFSLLVFQHFARVERKKFIQQISSSLMTNTGGTEVLSIQGSHVVFFLIPQERHSKSLTAFEAAISRSWGNKLKVTRHTQE